MDDTLVRKLKEHPGSRAIPIVFLTSQKSIEDKIRDWARRGGRYLASRSSCARLIARVNLLIARRTREASPPGATSLAAPASPARSPTWAWSTSSRPSR
ncbi:MAG: hypothetical protein R3B70_47595 [Polyangiaceae bacterium]